jgi:hypothetical protein
MIKYAEIEQYRHIIKAVQERAYYTGKDENGENTYDETLPLPTLQFTGTVKSHGTNASVVQYPDGTLRGKLVGQSKNQEFGIPGDGHFGFVEFISEHITEIVGQFSTIRTFFSVPENHAVAVFGEWCGKGINKGCAVHEIKEKFWVMFTICVVGEDIMEHSWYPIALYPELQLPATFLDRVYSINAFPKYHMGIDFNNPAEAQEKLDALTLAVEDVCPIGKHLGAEGIGEGIVWTCTTPPFDKASRFWFKTKGPKHRIVEPKRTQGTEIDPEIAKSIDEFIEVVVTPARLEQGMQHLREEGVKFITEKSTGDFLKWISNDVLKEEADRLELSKLDRKVLNRKVSKVARDWFFAQLDKDL